MSWKFVNLSEVAEIIAGQSPESKYYNQKGEGIPFFQGKADFSLVYPVIRYWCTNPTKIAYPFDILLSVRAPVGPTNICNTEACIGRGLAAIRAGKNLDYKYLYYYFKYFEEKLSSQGNGSTFSAITSGDVRAIQIPLPPLPIQKRIAEILDAADALRRKDQEVLKKYDELAQAIFIDMFGDPVKNEKGWEVKKLGDITTIRRGASPRPIEQFIGNDIPWIKIGDGTKGSNIYIEKTAVKITNAGAARSVLLEPGSLIFANCGVSLGFARILNISGCIHDGWLSIEKIDERLLNKIFILKYINLLTDYFRKTAPEGTQPNLNTGIMKNHAIIIPPISQQNKFAQLILDIETTKLLFNQNKAKGEILYDSLIQKAFTGALVN